MGTLHSAINELCLQIIDTGFTKLVGAIDYLGGTMHYQPPEVMAFLLDVSCSTQDTSILSLILIKAPINYRTTANGYSKLNSKSLRGWTTGQWA